MPTTTPLTDAINALTTYSNTVTGASDTTLSDAVATLASGYGGGGYDIVDILNKTEPHGDVVIDSDSNFNVRNNFFQGYTVMTSFSSNKAKEFGSYVFQNCTNLVTVNIPNCSKFESSLFEGCTQLTTITTSQNYSCSGGNTFRNCTSLTAFNCWASGTVATMFYGCSNLALLDMKNLNLYNLSVNCFQNCSALNVLILRKTSGIVGLAGTGAFTGTPFASGGSGGTIYVPSALVSQYQQASNWSTIIGYANNQIKAIEGSIYE